MIRNIKDLQEGFRQNHSTDLGFLHIINCICPREIYMQHFAKNKGTGQYHWSLSASYSKPCCVNAEKEHIWEMETSPFGKFPFRECDLQKQREVISLSKTWE